MHIVNVLSLWVIVNSVPQIDYIFRNLWKVNLIMYFVKEIKHTRHFLIHTRTTYLRGFSTHTLVTFGWWLFPYALVSFWGLLALLFLSWSVLQKGWLFGFLLFWGLFVQQFYALFLLLLLVVCILTEDVVLILLLLL